MAGDRWIFTPEQLVNTPSRKCNIDADKELNYRQQAANLIQDMGQRLQVTQLCIYTAIVYMHRFYMFHSFNKFQRHSMASACLFLAAKVEEQPRKLEHVLKILHLCVHQAQQTPFDTKSEAYLEQAQELVINENILLQTLGFEITVDHPHTHIVRTCQLVKASKDLAQTSYFLATNSLHLATMCLKYTPTVVACVCIHLACKWSGLEIPRSSEGKEWFYYTDQSVTLELLEELTQEFLEILDKCPSKLKRKILTYKAGCRVSDDVSHKRQKTEHGASSASGSSQKQASASTSSHASHTFTNHDRKLPPAVAGPSRPPEGSTMRRVRTEPNLTPREYLERREAERREKIRIEREREKLAREHGRVSHDAADGAHFHSPALRPAPPDGDGVHSVRAAERHHMDVFSSLQHAEKSARSQRGERHHRSSSSHEPSKAPSGAVPSSHGKERMPGGKGHPAVPNALQARADNAVKHSHHDARQADLVLQQGALPDEKHAAAARLDKAHAEHSRRTRNPVPSAVTESVAGLDIKINAAGHLVTPPVARDRQPEPLSLPGAVSTAPVVPTESVVKTEPVVKMEAPAKTEPVKAEPTVKTEPLAVDSPAWSQGTPASQDTPEREKLKIRLDLKDVKTASPAKKSSERRKELKMKIVKTGDSSTCDKPELKLKLKMPLPMPLPPEAPATSRPDDEEEEEGQIVSPVAATPIKLVLSKDRTSGQYSSERHKHKHSGDWRGHHRHRHRHHGADGKKHSSRKRPHSPTAGGSGSSAHGKPQTNAASSAAAAAAAHTPVKTARHAHAAEHRFHDNAARDTNGNHGDDKPAVTPDMQTLDNLQRQLQQLIKQSEAKLQVTQHHPGDFPPPPPPPPLPSDQPPPPPPPPPP